MKTYLMLCMLIVASLTTWAQEKRFTKNGQISFFSKAPLENITSVNDRVLSVWNLSTGSIEFSVLIKGFRFEKALMQEHFNDDYMESDRFPKASFAGKLSGLNAINISVNKVYDVTVAGDLTIHGVTKKVSMPASITVANGIVNAKTSFKILLADYGIKVPGVVADNISKEILVQVLIPDYKILSL